MSPLEDALPAAPFARLVGRALALYARLVAATLRPIGPPMSQDQVLFAIWHETNLVGAVAAHRLRSDRRLVSFSTRGFRGIVMNAFLRGIQARSVTLPEEGRETRAEAARMSKELAAAARDGYSLVVSCDGPEGPYRVAKPGALLVARESGLPIQPLAVAVRPALRLRGRWDRQLVPLPFAGFRLEEGARITIDARARLKPLGGALQAALDEVARRADSRMR